MTKEERDKREAERKMRLAGSSDLGGISLPLSRGGLLRTFWIFAIGFVGTLFWESQGKVNGETFLATSCLLVLCFLPSWFWASGRVTGLPIFPVFGLGFLPTYVSPLWQGSPALVGVDISAINLAAWTVAGFLAASTLVWQQICVRNTFLPKQILMIEKIRSEWILMSCIIVQLVFEVGIYFFKDLGEGVFPVIRSFAGSAGRLGLFIFSYQIGKGKLSPIYRTLFVGCVTVILVRQIASLLLSTAIPTIGVLFAGYMLGKGRIPWLALGSTICGLGILQMGKVEMREQYFSGEKEISLLNSGSFFSEWVGYGLKNMGIGSSTTAKREDVASVKDRGSLIQLMVKVQEKTPSALPYLEGETYRYIPEMLIPRIFNKEKALAHTGNMILSIYYGVLERENVFATSIAFDPVIEAYANYGLAGVFLLAVFMGVLIGVVTNFSARVPMLSFGFLLGVQLLAVLLGSFNTAGVLVTSLWQSLISLALLSIVLMKRLPNPLYARPGALPKIGDGRSDIGGQKTEAGGQMAEVGGQQAVISGHPSSISENPSTVQKTHERPKRFVYGEKKK